MIVLASGGSFTDDYSHEFQTFCETGEDLIFFTKSKDVYYNREVAPSTAPKIEETDKEMLPKKMFWEKESLVFKSWPTI